MKACIWVIFLSVFFICVMQMELDQDMASLLNERIKNALNRATHDASLQINQQQLSIGSSQYDQTAALSVFRKTLAFNLGLNPLTLKPLENTIFSTAPVIEFIDFIDDNDNISFPYLYQNNTYRINKIIRGPAIVTVISIEKPLLSALSAKLRYRKWAVYEYPFDSKF